MTEHAVSRTEDGLDHHNTLVFGRPTITSVELVMAQVLGSHEVVRDWEQDWTASGQVAMPPISTATRADPWTLTVGHRLQLQLELTVKSELAGPEGFVVTGSFKELTFEATVTLRGGTNRIEITSREPLSRWPTPMIGLAKKEDGRMKLHLRHEMDPKLAFDFMLALQGAVTFDVPRHGYNWDRGLTWKRVVQATTRIRDLENVAFRTDVFDIARELIRIVPGYTTVKDDALKDVDHPRYQYEQKGGAWVLLDHVSALAECQAICRLALALMRHAGCPGDLELVTVWADKPGATLQVHESEGHMAGLNFPRGAPFQALTDRDLVVGRRYTLAEAGLNRYEACLRVRQGGTTKYFGGGMRYPEHGTPSAVLAAAFAALVEARWTDGEEELLVTRVLHRW